MKPHNPAVARRVVTSDSAWVESGGRILVEGSATECLSTEVPAASATYRPTVEASRSAEDASASTKVAGVWTFTSARPTPKARRSAPYELGVD
ncbi:hypothetical protein [Streptomyces sp. IB201691-2A2]|uniref:hypothetical protein n=1 Tax=Streptomyces sp. IB201691-2A2 TaxID=2561920 RepID=UPI00117E2FD4|nr:hypothetical protein [Streptomyces sp. IB201691-2A2]TRO58991.1 hypothetical protein E4K73_36745 [Streptomyces sp. IB201691-2A2]